MMNNAIKLTKGTQREYLTVGIGGDEIQNARQIVDLSNNTSTLEFDLETASRKWTFFEGMELDAEARGRKYCIWGEDTITKARDNSGTHLHVKLKETWYKLEKKYLTAHNVNLETSDFDHIDKNMVVLHGNSPDPLYINGTRVTCPYTVGTVQYHFWCVLYGTGWTLDTRYSAYWPDGKFDLESDKQDVLANIDILQKFYGGMLLWDSENKRVALVDESKYQVYEGFDIRYRKNIISIERKEDRNIITRLYVYGNSNLNIAAVNGGKEYIDNFSYTSETLEDVIQNGDIYDTEGSTDGQQRLLAWGKRESAFYAKPRYTYTVDICKYRDDENKAIPQPELAKLAKVVDEDIVGTPALQRILKIDQNVFVENDCNVVVGDILRTFAGKFKDLNADADKAGSTISGAGEVPGGKVRGKTPALVKSENTLNTTIIKTEENIHKVWTEKIYGENGVVTDYKTAISVSASGIRTTVSKELYGTDGLLGRGTSLVERYTSAISQTATEIRTTVAKELYGVGGQLGTHSKSIIQQTADSITSTVSTTLYGSGGSYENATSGSVVYKAKSEIKQQADRISLVVEGSVGNYKIRPAQIVASINKATKESSVLISADRVAISGITTFDNWVYGGTTEINGGKIRADTVTANQITSGAITTVKIAANAITTAKIAADAVTADEIASNAITASKIYAGAITSEKIATGAISADKISVSNLSVDWSNTSSMKINRLTVHGELSFNNFNTRLSLLTQGTTVNLRIGGRQARIQSITGLNGTFSVLTAG